MESSSSIKKGRTGTNLRTELKSRPVEKYRGHLVSLKEAQEILGFKSYSSFFTTKRLTNYMHKTVYGWYFDISKYRKDMSMEDYFRKQCLLFIEWMVHEKGMSYADIARASGVSVSGIREHKARLDSLYKVCLAHKSLIAEFDEYYN